MLIIKSMFPINMFVDQQYVVNQVFEIIVVQYVNYLYLILDVFVDLLMMLILHDILMVILMVILNVLGYFSFGYLCFIFMGLLSRNIDIGGDCEALGIQIVLGNEMGGASVD